MAYHVYAVKPPGEMLSGSVPVVQNLFARAKPDPAGNNVAPVS